MVKTVKGLRSFFILLLFILLAGSSTALGGSILYSKHDLAHLNQRALAKGAIGGMEGRGYNDYQEVCVYCHTPHNKSRGQAPLWNRQMPETSEYKMYTSQSMNSEISRAPDGVSLACLSCHDGSLAVDAIVNPPKWTPWTGTGVHYKMRQGGPGSESCGTCHSKDSIEGTLLPNISPSAGVGGAHDGSTRYLEKDLTNDHPVSFRYPEHWVDPQFNRATVDGFIVAPDGNLLKLFDGKVQCATCHDPHDPDEKNLEGRDPFLRASVLNSKLCFSCHNK